MNKKKKKKKENGKEKWHVMDGTNIVKQDWLLRVSRIATINGNNEVWKLLSRMTHILLHGFSWLVQNE